MTDQNPEQEGGGLARLTDSPGGMPEPAPTVDGTEFTADTASKPVTVLPPVKRSVKKALK